MMFMEVADAINKIAETYLEKYGKIEPGDRAAFVLNDAVVILSMEPGRNLKIDIIAGEPDWLDITLDLIEKETE